MDIKVIKVYITIVFVVLLVSGVISARVDANDQYLTEQEFLKHLQILPPDFALQDHITSKQYVALLEKLVNGRGNDSLVNLAGKVSLPDTPISYQEALTIGGIFMGYSRDKSYSAIKKITPEVFKEDQSKLTGLEMTYIFYQLLHNKRNGQTKTLLEERYLVGSNPKIVTDVREINDDQLILADGSSVNYAVDVLAFVVNASSIEPIDFANAVLKMAELQLLFDESGVIKTVLTNGQERTVTIVSMNPESTRNDQNADFELGDSNIIDTQSTSTKLKQTMIRVLLSEELDQAGSSKSYDFSEIQIKATQPFKVVVVENGAETTELVVEKDEVVTFTNYNDNVRFTTENGDVVRIIDSRVYLKSYYSHTINFDPLLSTPRRGNVPVYTGVLEIFAAEKPAHLNMVNELPLEMYLRRVVPDQIPSSWPLEAFKVQAIAARSYALTQINRGKFKDWSADVDDSVASQIYNSVPELAKINQAIQETEGLVAVYNDKIIDGVYFSTSAGFTTNSEDVWHNVQNNEFPGMITPYLHSVSLLTGLSKVQLDTEAKMLEFFKDKSIQAYDSASPFFRWEVELTREELENTINRNLPLREKADQVLGTNFIQTLNGAFVFPGDTSFSIGKLLDIRVTMRGEGGNIMALDIVGMNGSYRVLKEYNVRFIIRPNRIETKATRDVKLLTHDGGYLTNYSILPSAFAAFELIKNIQGDIERVKIYGGGMGHGVGLSQWGMRGMALQGFTYQEILEHFYTGIKLKRIY